MTAIDADLEKRRDANMSRIRLQLTIGMRFVGTFLDLHPTAVATRRVLATMSRQLGIDTTVTARPRAHQPAGTLLVRRT